MLYLHPFGKLMSHNYRNLRPFFIVMWPYFSFISTKLYRYKVDLRMKLSARYTYTSSSIDRKSWVKLSRIEPMGIGMNFVSFLLYLSLYEIATWTMFWFIIKSKMYNIIRFGIYNRNRETFNMFLVFSCNWLLFYTFLLSF